MQILGTCGRHPQSIYGGPLDRGMTKLLNLQFDDVPRYKLRKAGDNKRKFDLYRPKVKAVTGSK